jgi:predicted CDP-diglyceride synthetase/phosphatidate cytidylyltransferase
MGTFQMPCTLGGAVAAMLSAAAVALLTVLAASAPSSLAFIVWFPGYDEATWASNIKRTIPVKPEDLILKPKPPLVSFDQFI